MKRIISAFLLLTIALFSLGLFGCKEEKQVKFSLNYEGSTPVIVWVEKGKPVSPIEPPLREGYYFIGWYYSPTLEKKVDFSKPVEKDVIYYAGWEKTQTTRKEFLDAYELSASSSPDYKSVTGASTTTEIVNPLSVYSDNGTYYVSVNGKERTVKFKNASAIEDFLTLHEKSARYTEKFEVNSSYLFFEIKYIAEGAYHEFAYTFYLDGFAKSIKDIDGTTGAENFDCNFSGYTING